MTQATFKKGAKMERWEKKLENPQAALKQIGALIVSESEKAFLEQQHGEDKWKPRAPINIFGIISDFAKGGKPPGRRFETRPVLKDTGRLSGSIASKIESSKTVVVGSNLSYAAKMHYGGETESETITSEVQSSLKRWLKSKPESMKEKLGWLLNKKYTGEKLKMEVPARPFVGITKMTIVDIRETVGVEIMEVK